MSSELAGTGSESLLRHVVVETETREYRSYALLLCRINHIPVNVLLQIRAERIHGEQQASFYPENALTF